MPEFSARATPASSISRARSATKISRAAPASMSQLAVSRGNVATRAALTPMATVATIRRDRCRRAAVAPAAAVVAENLLDVLIEHRPCLDLLLDFVESLD